MSASLPLAKPSPLPFQAPPYDRLHDQDHRPAIEAGMQRRRAEIRDIDADPAPPAFDNTIVALERSRLGPGIRTSGR